MRLSALALASTLSVLCHAQSWHPVAGGAASTVYSLEPFAGDLYAGGLFTSIDGQPAQYLARWDGSAWHPVANLITYMAADGLHANDTALFIGDGGRVRFWNGSNLFNLTGVNSSSFNSTVYAIAHFQDTLYCGGFFSSPFARIAKWNGTAYEAVTSGCNAQVSFLTPFQDQLFVGGNFQLAGDSLVNHTALWDGEAWHAMGAGVNNDVFAHCFFQDTLYIGGRFTSANGQVASRVAKWNGSQWVRVGGTLNDYVTAMTVYRDQLYIGGAFTTPSHIARLSGTSWVPVGSGCNDQVRSMEVYHDTLFVGGSFTQAGGIDASRIAKWHLPQPPVANFEVDDGTLCVNDCSIFSDLSPNGVATRLWEFPGGTPTTSTDSVVTVCYDAPGTYPATLTVSNAGGMDASTLLDAVVVEICTAVAETARTGSLSLWPNPTHGTLSVQWEHDTPMRATLLNATGRTLGNYLLQPGANMIDLRGIAPGGYLLRTVDGRSLRVLIME